MAGPFNPATRMAFDPSGRIFYTEKAGAVRLIVNGVIQPAPVLAFDVDVCGERGLLGLALDPRFGENHYVYVFYTAASGCGNTTNRVVRFVETGGIGSDPVEIFSSPQLTEMHNGGALHFGPDGKLYISVGDTAYASRAQNMTVKNGKIHRINADGTIPPDNPVFTETGALPSIFARGVRNPFDFTFDPLSPYIFASENGPECDDEMNRIAGGYNYGWRDSYPCDDANPDPQYNTIRPLWFVPSGQCCVAPTGIEVYRGTSVPAWTDELFMCQYNYNAGGLIHFHLSTDRTQVLAAPLVSGVSCRTDLATGTDGALYYFEGGGWEDTTLKRIVRGDPTATPPGPLPTVTATSSATVTSTGTPPRLPTVTLTGTPPAGTTATPSRTPTTTPCALPSDVQPTDYFYTPVQYLYCRGVISGYADGTFRPYNNSTRAQMVKIVVLGFGIAIRTPAGGAYSFADVPPGQPFFAYVETATANGVAVGYTCGGPGEACDGERHRYFRPNANVTRGQLAKIVVAAAGWSPATAAGSFADVPADSSFSASVETAYCHGILTGYDCGGAGEPCDARDRPYFRPAHSATRGQIAKIVYNALTDALPCAATGPGAR